MQLAMKPLKPDDVRPVIVAVLATYGSIIVSVVIALFYP